MQRDRGVACSLHPLRFKPTCTVPHRLNIRLRAACGAPHRIRRDCEKMAPRLPSNAPPGAAAMAELSELPHNHKGLVHYGPTSRKPIWVEPARGMAARHRKPATLHAEFEGCAADRSGNAHPCDTFLIRCATKLR